MNAYLTECQRASKNNPDIDSMQHNSAAQSNACLCTVAAVDKKKYVNIAYKRFNQKMSFIFLSLVVLR